jgi:hypothetical protein
MARSLGKLAANRRANLAATPIRGQLCGLLLTDEELQRSRALEVLERIGAPEARRLLERLAGGAPGALTTTSARASLGRLARQSEHR